MNLYEADKAIKQRWMQLWHTLVGGSQAAPTIPYRFDNDVGDETWPQYARVTVSPNGSERITVGNVVKHKRRLIILIKLNGPMNEGAKAMLQLVPHVQAIYECKRFGGLGQSDGVVCESAEPFTGASDGKYWMLPVTVHAHYFE